MRTAYACVLPPTCHVRLVSATHTTILAHQQGAPLTNLPRRNKRSPHVRVGGQQLAQVRGSGCRLRL